MLVVLFFFVGGRRNDEWSSIRGDDNGWMYIRRDSRPSAKGRFRLCDGGRSVVKCV